MSLPNADNIAFNLRLFNDTNNPIIAERYQSRDQPYISNIENYYVRLASATISKSAIPLFIYHNEFILYMTNGLNSLSQTIVFENYYPSFYQSNQLSIVWIQQFLDGINSSLTSLHNALGNPGNAPIMIYDTDDKIKLVIDVLYDNVVNIIAFNYQLAEKLSALSTYYESTTNYYPVKYQRTGINYFSTGISDSITYPCVVMTAQVEGFAYLQSFYKILLTSSSLPINRQYVTTRQNLNSSFPIIDYIPIRFDQLTTNANIVYQQLQPKYIDLNSQGSISEIDFKLYTVDSHFDVTPLQIEPGDTVDIELEFINKKLVKNFYPKL